MWPARISNPGPLTYELGALPTALRGPAPFNKQVIRKSKASPNHLIIKVIKQCSAETTVRHWGPREINSSSYSKVCKIYL